MKKPEMFLILLIFILANLILPRDLRAAGFTLHPFKLLSESGQFQFGLSGRAILEAFVLGSDGAGLISTGSEFLSGRGSLFADLYLGGHVYATAEFRLDTGEAPKKGVVTGRMEQAFVRYKPVHSRTLYLQYGKFVSPFGAYNQRHDSVADPFIRPPLMYDYRTMVSADFIPRSNDGFISWKYAPQIWRPRGAPPIWGNPYQWGGMFFGSVQKMDFRFAVMNSAPSSDPGMWDHQPGQEIHPSLVVHAGCRILPGFYLGGAFNHGPYLGERAKATIPEDEFNSYKQQIWEMEFLFERGKTQIRGEVFRDQWEVKGVRDYPVDVSGYFEVKQKFLSGFYAAFRYGTIRYNEISRSNGSKEAWDFNIWRAQAALGYRIFRNLDFRTEYMYNRTSGLPDPSDNLFSAQLRFEF
jgi:hypothetical protein